MNAPVFTERSIAAGGSVLRCLEAGSGETLVCLLDGAGLRSARAHALMAEQRRVLVFAPPEGAAAPAFARSISAAMETLGIERCDVVGQGDGAAAALFLALARPGTIGAVALVAPTALADGGQGIAPRLAELKCPVLALFGTRDAIAPPEHGGRYRALLPDCHLMFVYDAAHAVETERPEALASIALEFFERRDLFLVNRDSGKTFP
ncbi:MAG TPA: hypothetical protein VN802_02525 [Stellaceae bacterium]|nr:hypothetical protein [Stellaceae bacterium]